MAKSSITKITEISNETRQLVYQRQKGFSPFGNWLGGGCQYHHVVNSGLGAKGVGYEFNIVALTPEEHRAIHDKQPIKVNGRVRYSYEKAITIIKNHLKVNYYGWSEDKCKLHKGWSEEDYKLKRIEKL